MANWSNDRPASGVFVDLARTALREFNLRKDEAAELEEQAYRPLTELLEARDKRLSLPAFTSLSTAVRTVEIGDFNCQA